MKTVFLLLICLAGFCPAVFSQTPNSAGALLYTQLEPGDSGNGAILGVEFQTHLNFKISGEHFAFIERAQITRDLKKYLGEYGTAIRTLTLIRADIKGPVFVEAGAKLSGVNYPGPGGYGKWGAQAAAGAGVRLSGPRGQVWVFEYLYFLRAPLYGQKALFDSTGRILDGWTTGQQAGMQFQQPFKGKWLALVNVSAGQTVYQRNPDQYGAALGAIKHRFTVVELSFGVGRRF